MLVMISRKKLFALSLWLICIVYNGPYATCQMISGNKLDCYPIDGATKEKCEALGCVWSPVEKSNNLYKQEANDWAEQKSRVDEPWCYFPENYIGYQVTSVEKFDADNQMNHGRTHKISLARVKKSVLGDDIESVSVELYLLDYGRMLRLRVTDASKSRFEPELPKLSLGVQSGLPAYPDQFLVELTKSGSEKDQSDQLNSTLTIRRSTNGAILFSTDLRRLIFAEKFIQLNSRLNSPFVYGLGEHYDSFLKLADQFKTYSFWNTDKLPTPGGQRSYGTFPFYINLDKQPEENKRQAFGVYLHNSNAMDIVLQKDVSITFRPIGGILDYFMFIGPEPLDVASQFQSLVGLPELPPRWALGFQLCRYNYGSLNKTKLVWKRTQDAGIPFDVQWNDIDYMHRFNDFTYDMVKFAGLPQFVDELHEKYNMHYMLLIDPGISQEENYYPYQLGDKMDIWIKNATNQTLVGKVWNQSGRTVFPDFSNPDSRKYWRDLFVEFHQRIKFDGAWIDMNDISNFVDGSLDGCPDLRRSDSSLKDAASVEHTPYKPGGFDLQHKSLCLSAKHFNNQLEFDLHNLYSFYEAIATREALEAARPKKRSLIISRSTHPGQGRYGGHWSGDVLSNWNYLKWSIPSLLEHSLYGFSMIGTDICGFNGNTTPELCARWSTLGAFYTFSRNHNDDVSIDQDPVALGPDVIEANRNAFRKKYSLLPYFYTLLMKAHTYGELVARSLSFEFFDHQDDELLTIESQFMIGSALMISPILEEKTYSVRSYLPKGRWYQTDILPESVDLAPKLINSSGQFVETNNISLANLPLFIRGGHIIPFYTRVGATTIDTVREQPISLEIALCQMNRAKGDMTFDDGETTDIRLNKIDMFVYEGTLLNVTVFTDTYQEQTPLGQVKVYGLNKQVSEVKIHNGKKLPFTQEGHMLRFDLGGILLSKHHSLIVKWY